MGHGDSQAGKLGEGPLRSEQVGGGEGGHELKRKD